MPVTLINPFTVPPGQEKAFLESWRETAGQATQASGFLGLRMYRSLDPKAGFRFVNVAQWESEAAWRAAFAQIRVRETGPGIEAHPALYEVVAEY